MENQRLLLVEGTDDKHVLIQICKKRNIELITQKTYGDKVREASLKIQLSNMISSSEDIHQLIMTEAFGDIDVDKIIITESFEGVKGLIKNLGVRVKVNGQDGDKILGAIVDADSDISSRWQGIRDRLVKAGYDVPNQPAPCGMILDSSDALPRLGIWVMPNNQTSGALEDFLHSLIPQTSDLLKHAEKSVEEIPENARLFSECKKTKAVIHTWLAWQESPGLRFGTAINAGFLNSHVQQVNALVSWIKRLYCLD